MGLRTYTIMKKIDGPVKYGMVLEGITVITHSNILHDETNSELKRNKNYRMM